ncbi:hypothetical protein M0805_006223 [Coniferiporia weirii]|nr:hypothetical protein M0805_006223 [Coniferiporia weirii]
MAKRTLCSSVSNSNSNSNGNSISRSLVFDGMPLHLALSSYVHTMHEPSGHPCSTFHALSTHTDFPAQVHAQLNHDTLAGARGAHQAFAGILLPDRHRSKSSVGATSSQWPSYQFGWTPPIQTNILIVPIASGSAPEAFELTKTLVFKPKTPKSATPVPLVVIAREETKTSSTALSKKLNLKKLCLASADILTEFFALDKDSLSPLALNAQTFLKVVTVLDASLASSSATFAVHALASDSTVFLSGSDIAAYLRQLETADIKILEIDFDTLKTETAASASPSKAAAQEKPVKEEAKTEGAVQIAIGVKKDVDFPTWYTNVLIKADMLDYYSVSGCYILKSWSYGIWEAIQE